MDLTSIWQYIENRDTLYIEEDSMDIFDYFYLFGGSPPNSDDGSVDWFMDSDEDDSSGSMLVL